MPRETKCPVFSVSAKVSSLMVLFAVLCVAIVVDGQQTDDSPANWFAHPTELPKDVFDSPYFDSYRVSGKLNAHGAQNALEELSDNNLPAAQRLFDIFAWRAFVALNSPALANGEPNEKWKFEEPGDGPLVWEFWQQPSDIFLPNGATPKWVNSPNHAMDHFKAGWRQTPSVNEGKQAFSGPLIDQQGHWVHYVSLVNRKEFDYLRYTFRPNGHQELSTAYLLKKLLGLRENTIQPDGTSSGRKNSMKA